MSSFSLFVIAILYFTYPSDIAAESCDALTERFGGTGGGAFDDSQVLTDPSTYTDISAIELDCGPVVSSIKVTYGNIEGPKHGWGRSNCYNWWTLGDRMVHELEWDEYISGVDVTYDDSYLRSLIFRTNKRVLPRCGTSTGTKSKSITGRRLKYIVGSSGCIVDSLRFYMPSW